MSLISQLSKIKKISLGDVILVAQLFILVNVVAFFPQNMVSSMEKLIIVYLLIHAVVYAIPDLRSRLLDVPVWEIKNYLVALIISVLAMSLMAQLLYGGRTEALTVYTALSTVTVSMILVHLLIIAVIEEFFFRDYLAGKVGGIWSSVLFGVFHFSVYKFNVWAVLWASLLGYGFYLVKQRWSPKTNLVNIALHGGYNIVILGLINILRGGAL